MIGQSQTTDANTIVVEDLDTICSNMGDQLNKLAGKRLLLTGGAGFLGYYLVQSLLRWNESRAADARVDVVVYDNFIRGVPEWLSAIDDPSLTIITHDICNPLPATSGDFHYIIHAASIASPIYYRKNPIATMDANVNGLRHLLDYAVERQASESPVEGFLFFSTSEIYGDPQPEFIPTPETYRGNVSCTGPRACYDESKRYGETLCVNFAQQYELPIRIARPFNNYGPGLKITDRRALPDFARDVFDGRDIVLLSDGAPTRTFCYITDAITGYLKTLLLGRDGEAYNIGMDQPEISIAGLADRTVLVAKELFDYQGQVVKKESSDAEYLTDNPNRRCPVIDKARTELGYQPNVGIEQGLRRSMVWYSANRDAQDA